MRVIFHIDNPTDLPIMEKAAYVALREYGHGRKRGDLIGIGNDYGYFSVYWNKDSITVRKSL